LVFVAAGDLTGDDRAELVVVNKDANTINVLDHAEGGYFVARTVPLSGFSYPQKAAVADLDADAWGDVIVIGEPGGPGSDDGEVQILLNQGAGLLAPPVSIPTGKQPNGLVVADLNGDDYPDIATAGWTEGIVSVHLNLGMAQPGTFAERVDLSDGLTKTSLAAGDLDGDGVVDLVATLKYDHAVSIWLNEGDGALTNAGLLEVKNDPSGVALGDLNRDGRADIVVGVTEGVSVLLSLP
jgi:hypothetical protein